MKTLIIMIFLLAEITTAQNISFSAAAAVKQFRFEDRDSYTLLQMNDGFSTTVYGIKASVNPYVDFLIINRVELSFLFFRKEIWERRISQTTVEFPGGTGQYIDAADRFYDYEIIISPKHYFDLSKKGRVGIGPLIGYGNYLKSFQSEEEMESSYSELIYGFEGTLVYSMYDFIAFRGDIYFIHFRPSGTGYSEQDESAGTGVSGNPGINTFISDLGGLSVNLGLEFIF